MNRLFVNDTLYELTDAYKLGALKKRVTGTMKCNPFKGDDVATAEWVSGYLNEEKMLHVVNNCDVITSLPNDEVDFTVDRIPNPKAPKRETHRYALALMNATGMKDDAVELMQPTVPTPGVLAQRLREKGHYLSAIFAEMIVHRIRLERQMSGTPLSARELDRVGNLPPGLSDFLLTLGKLQDEYFSITPSLAGVARALGKSEEWALALTRTVRDSQLDFLIEKPRSRCRPSAKGWLVIDMIRARELDADLPANALAM